MTIFRDALQTARDTLERGEFRKAFTHIVDVPVTKPDELFDKIGLMADTGVALRDVSILQYGLYLMEHHKEQILAVPVYVPFHWFNLGNFHLNLASLKEAEGAERPWYRREETSPIKTAYARARETAEGNDELKTAILTAHARFFVSLGRDWEAFEFFHEAVQRNPENIEAFQGRTETLAALAGTAPSLETDLLKEVRDELKRLEGEKDRTVVDETVDRLRTFLKKRLDPEAEETVYPRNTIVTRSDNEHFHVMFALKHRLFLSPCAACRRCDRSVGDAAILGSHHTVIGKGRHDFFGRMVMLFARLTERYRVLRTAVTGHAREGADIGGPDTLLPDPEVGSWTPFAPATNNAAAVLAGSKLLLEGMAAFVSLFLGREPTGSIRPETVFGTPKVPRNELVSHANPALHGFWDLWADGWEGMIPGAELPELFGNALTTAAMEELLGDPERFTERAVGTLTWFKNLLGYLVRMADREAGGDVDDPPVWPLQPFVHPRGTSPGRF